VPVADGDSSSSTSSGIAAAAGAPGNAREKGSSSSARPTKASLWGRAKHSLRNLVSASVADNPLVAERPSTSPVAGGDDDFGGGGGGRGGGTG